MWLSRKLTIGHYLFELFTGLSLIILIYLLRLKQAVKIESSELLFVIDILLMVFFVIYIVVMSLFVLRRYFSHNKDKTSELGDTKKIIRGYFLVLITTTLLGLFLSADLNLAINFLGAWLFVFEIVLGMAAASKMHILTSMSTIKAKGLPVNESTIIQQRLRDEEETVRSPWLITFAINTVLLFVISI